MRAGGKEGSWGCEWMFVKTEGRGGQKATRCQSGRKIKYQGSLCPFLCHGPDRKSVV